MSWPEALWEFVNWRDLQLFFCLHAAILVTLITNSYFIMSIFCFCFYVTWKGTWNSRAAAYTLLNMNNEAIVDCLKSIEINPNYSKAYSRLGSAYFALGNYQDALYKGYLKGNYCRGVLVNLFHSYEVWFTCMDKFFWQGPFIWTVDLEVKTFFFFTFSFIVTYNLKKQISSFLCLYSLTFGHLYF